MHKACVRIFRLSVHTRAHTRVDVAVSVSCSPTPMFTTAAACIYTSALFILPPRLAITLAKLIKSFACCCYFPATLLRRNELSDKRNMRFGLNQEALEGSAAGRSDRTCRGEGGHRRGSRSVLPRPSGVAAASNTVVTRERRRELQLLYLSGRR